MPQTVYRQRGIIGSDGKLEISVPLHPGTPVEIMVLAPEPDDCADLVTAAQSSMDFWNNSIDDEDWNETHAG